MKRKPTQAQMDNLKKGHRFTSENARENQLKGAAAKVAANKRNQDLDIISSTIAGSEITDEKLKKKLTDLGVTDEELTNNAQVVNGVFRRATRGEITAVEKWEEWLDRADADVAEEIERIENEENRALALARAHYLENINSTFGAISVYALKHRYTHYEASGGRGSTKSSWASLTIVRLFIEHPDVHALVLRKVANTLRDSVYNRTMP